MKIYIALFIFIVNILLISCGGTPKKENGNTSLDSGRDSLDKLESLKWAILYKDVDELGVTVFGGDGSWSYYSSYYGTYIWEEDCNDCKKIVKRLTLKDDFRYEFRIEYIGSDKPYIEKANGFFSIDKIIKAVILYQKKGEDWIKSIYNWKDNSFVSDEDDEIVYRKLFSNDLTDEKWYLSSINDILVGESNGLESDNPYIKFENEGRVSGSTSCNNYNGKFDVDEKGLVTIRDLIMTRKACLDSDLESKYLEILSQVISYRIEGDTLSIMNSENAIIAKFVR